jgi:hypothetical protein
MIRIETWAASFMVEFWVGMHYRRQGSSYSHFTLPYTDYYVLLPTVGPICLVIDEWLPL